MRMVRQPAMWRVFIMVLWAVPAWAAGPEPIPGKPFSDPDVKAHRSAAWTAGPITYGKWAKGADIAITLDQRQYYVVLPLIQKLAREQGINVAVNEGTCGHSEGMIKRKKVDISGWCCPPATYDRLPGLVYHTVGIGALAIVTHADNPVEDITTDQARRIFMGQIVNWNQLPAPGGMGPDLPIRAVARLHCKLRPGHWRLILGHENQFGSLLAEVGTPPDQMITSLAAYKGAMGYEAVWNIDRYKDKGRTKALKIDGVSPYDTRAMIEGRYPFYRVYNLTTWDGEATANPKATALVKGVIDAVNRVDLDDNPIAMGPTLLLRRAGWKFKGNELVGEPH